MNAPAAAATLAAPVRAAVAGDRYAVEPTAIGAQSLICGVAPIALADRLAFRAAAPLEPKKPQRPADHGLFDLAARNQLDFFQPKDI